MGVLLGIPLAITSRIGSHPKLNVRDLARPIAVLLILLAGCAVIGGMSDICGVRFRKKSRRRSLLIYTVTSFAKRVGDLSHKNCEGHIQRSIYVIGLRVRIVAQNLKYQRSVV